MGLGLGLGLDVAVNISVCRSVRMCFVIARSC